MSALLRHHGSASGRVAFAAAAMCLALLAAPRPAAAQSPTIVGYLSNFDVPNDVKDVDGNQRETEGFEIQIEGVQAADVVYAFGEAGALSGPPAPCYIRYCRPQIIQYATGVYVRWTVGGWDPVAQQFTSNFNLPNMVLTSAGTPPVASGVFFAGHQCWSMGLGAGYPQSGCEHFGVSLTRQPGPTTYRWIVGDSTTGGLTYADGTALPTATSLPPTAAVKSVPILVPVAQVPAAGVNAGQVEAVIQAPPPAPQPPAALAHRYGLAQWVKVYKKEIPRDADLDELVGGHPNANVPGIKGDRHDENAVAETEWKLLQLDTCNPDKGSSQLVNHGSSNSKSHSVVRRYEFYKYTGPVVAPGGTSGACGGGGSKIKVSTDDLVACVVDPATGECPAPGPGDLGDFIGAQNVADNINPNDGARGQTIDFAPLLDLSFGHAALTLNATASSNLPVTFATVGTCSVAGNTLTINGAGGCVVTASQAGDATFAPASDVLRSFIIHKAPQTISFSLPAGPFRFGDAAFVVIGSSDAGLPVAFAGSGGCSVAGTTVTITGAGLCQVTASQAGDADHDAAADVVQSTTIAKGAATISFDASSLAQTYDATLKTVATTTTPAGLAVIVNFTGTPQDAGSYPVAASIDDANYEGAASATLVIGKADAIVHVTPYSVTYDGSAHTATATATGVGGVQVGSFDLTGTSHTDAGAYAADAWSFAGGTNYNDAGGTITDSIAQASQTITFDALPNRTEGDAAFTVTASASSNLSVSFAAAGNCTVAGAVVTLGAAGTCTITASQPGNVNYLAATAVSQSFTIAPGVVVGGSPLVNPGDQTSREGDEVELRLQVIGAGRSAGSADDNDRLRGTFAASGLPSQLHIEKEKGVIRGHVAKNTAGEYAVTVTFTQNGVTFAQSFTWTVLKADRKSGTDR